MTTAPLRLLPPEAFFRTGPLDRAEWTRSGVLGFIERRRFHLAGNLLGAHASGGRLLEVGYGTGMFMPELARRCVELHGLDVHTHAAVVRQLLDAHDVTAELTRGSVEAMPYPDAMFDAVVAVSMLEFVDDAELAASEFARVLQPNGIAVVVTPGRSVLLDLGLRALTGERAEDTFRGRREHVVPALERALVPDRVWTYPRAAPSVARPYQALRLTRRESGAGRAYRPGGV